MEAKKREMKEFLVELSGSGDFVIDAKDKEDALRQIAKMSNSSLFDAMDVEFDVTEETDDSD